MIENVVPAKVVPADMGIESRGCGAKLSVKIELLHSSKSSFVLISTDCLGEC